MTLIRGKKRKMATTAFAVGASVFLIAVVAILVSINNHKEPVEKTITTVHREDESSEVHMSEEATTGEAVVEELREYYIDYVNVAKGQQVTTLCDIRIHFPNGEDFIVVSGKEITGQTDEGFFTFLDEREVHMISSARTDVEVYEGAYLYLAVYKTEYDKKTKANYPWNVYVISSYGLSEEDAEDVYNRRILLEENLLAFMNKALEK